ncbi:hypothetical protein HDU76_003445 [Blyttiomyces sp. JEL0837]|nr:hypothetical protein HDU76_003445 [Blyttiomyces sp. JEL0837]
MSYTSNSLYSSVHIAQDEQHLLSSNDYTSSTSTTNRNIKHPAVYVDNMQNDNSNDIQLQRSFAHEVELSRNEESNRYAEVMKTVGDVVGVFGMVIPCFACLNPFKVVPQGFVGLVSRFGRYYKSVDPGLCSVNVLTEKIYYVDVKTQVESLPEQIVMTKDNVQLSIDSVIYWEIVDPYTAKFLVANVREALVERTKTTLRHIFGTRTLQDSIENRETIAHEIQEIIEGPAKSWGVKVESTLIKDLKFSQDLQETLSSAAKQKRMGEAKIIIAQAEVESAKLMREASDVLNTPAAMQIRYLETLSEMAKSAGTKVVFMPVSGGGQSVGENGAGFKDAVGKVTMLEATDTVF